MSRVSHRLNVVVHSIRFKLALWFVLILGVVLVLFSAFIYTRQLQVQRALAIDRLELKARRLSGPDRFFDRGPLNNPASGDNSSLSLSDAGIQENDILVFINSQNQVVQSIGPLQNGTAVQLVNQDINQSTASSQVPNPIFFARVPGTSTGLLSSKSYALMIGPAMIDNRLGGYYLLGTPVDPDGQLPLLLFTLGLGVAAMLSVALFGGFWLADRAIRPVKKITQTARQISGSDLSQRIDLNQQDELGELANTFDDMLERLQAAFERQRRFTADASHELRTPLTIVELESAHALATTRPQVEYERVLRVIQSENQFMSRLVNNLLTLARMDAGQVTLNMEEVDLSDVALEVIERLMPLAKKKKIVLEPGDLPELPVVGDRQYLVQMISNLVENAMKHSFDDDCRVEVSTGARSAGDNQLAWVRVTDNGPGIPSENLPHIFDRFYQVDKVRTRSEVEEPETGSDQTASGTGLGLSIVQWIAHAHGGEIRVESELGSGSTFEVTLPLARPVAETAPDPQEAVQPVS